MNVALVSGGNRGLGYATAQQLIDAGLRVVIGSRDPEQGERAATRLGVYASAVPLDVTDPASVAAAARTVEQQHGVLDVLVNNAGILPEATAGELPQVVDLELFRQTFDTNLFGAVSMAQHFLPLLRKAPQGRIVNVSTVMGSLTDQNNPDSPYHAMVLPAYQSSKAALNSVTIGLAKALADTPIVVTSVCPGFVQTDLTPVNRDQAQLTAEQAARVVVAAAIAGPGTPSGQFVDAAGSLPW